MPASDRARLWVKGKMGFDYRLLLKKYLNHVGYEEGSTFVGYLEYSEVKFTKEEIAELEKIDKEPYP